MTEPTSEQIKKFWEWCGFNDVHYNALGAVDQKWAGWLTKDGKSKDFRYLNLDLNNLFKYAVPKLGDCVIEFEYYESTDVLCQLDIALNPKVYQGESKDPALALFWAIMNKDDFFLARFFGKMKLHRVYNRALSASEIANIYNSERHL